jgi:hypothetical protein
VRQVGLDCDAEAIEQGDRPARLEALPGRRATQRKEQQGDEDGGANEQGEADNAPGAEQKIGFVQAACPR